MNLVVLSGRLTKEPDIRYTNGNNGQMAVARFSLAVDRRFKKDGEQSADFINCVAFGKTAEFVEKYIKKATKVNVVGEWKTGNYTDKNGNKVYTNDCNVTSIEFGESKKEAQQNNQQSVPTEHVPADGFLSIDPAISEELPFA